MNDRQPTVLVVDDLPLNRMLVVLALKQMGWRALEACDGMEALAAACQGDFDLIVMDCQMPVMDGLTAAARLRAGGCGVPILAYTSQENREECLRAGMDDHLCKPAPLAVLKGRLEYWLRRAA
jgi:CheY-like chemotaxis protein